jgi:hypothetical protein
VSTEAILNERQKTHGEFSSHAVISQELKDVVGRYERGLNAAQRESLDMICHKIARILNGNPSYKDHWDDIAGYAVLVSREIEKEEKKA